MAFSVEFIRRFEDACEIFLSLMEKQGFREAEKKEKPRPKDKELEKQVRRLEREIEKQEKLLAGLEEQVAAASADYQELSHLLEEKEREDAVLSNLMEQWESAADLLG